MKLSAWKIHNVSLNGRATLVQDTLTAIPTYSMQAEWLLQAICKSIDKAAKGCLWNSVNEGHGTHLVSQDKVTMQKRCGGLGIRDARMNNVSLLGKIS